MKFGPVPVAQAEGKILAHNMVADAGRSGFRKGKIITADDVAALGDRGYTTVYVAEPEPGDVGETSAAQRIAQAALGAGLQIKGASGGKANLVATVKGVLKVDPHRLERINRHSGIAFATLPTFRLVNPGQVIATVKIIPYALPETTLRQVEEEAAGGSAVI